MPDPTLDLAQAKRLMDALYGPGDTIYVCAYHDRNKGTWCQSRLTYDDGFSVGVFIRVANVLRQAVATTVGVFASEAPGFEARRTEDQCVGLSAFGIDIDPEDLAALVPGATAAEEVIPEVVRRLDQAGIPPHALVRSGRGLHVYLLVERAKFTTNEERTRAKGVWFRLTKLLGGASDRYDLSSYLRVPGTVNRKGEPVRVEFVEEHTHLDRPRYTLEQVAAAVAHLPGLPAGSAVRNEGKGKRAKKTGVVSVAPEMLRQEPWNLHLFGLAMRLDKRLAEARQVSLDATPPKEGKLDRSKNDFHYACRMLELGLPSSIVMGELVLTARGRVESEGWRVSTFSEATQQVYPTERRVGTGTWASFSESDEALFTGIEGPAHEKHRALLSSRGDFAASSTAPAAPEKPAVGVVLARPGKGKTRGIVHWLATNRHLYTRRLGICGSMVRELLRHEYAINAAFPLGLATTISEMPYEFEPDLPETHEALWARLPAKVKKRIDTTDPVDDDGKFRPNWTLEKLKVVVTDPAAFHINARHPLHLDEAIQPHEDAEGHYVYSLGGEKPDPLFETQPAAVVKFKGRPDLCLAGRSAEQLRDRRACLEWCDFSSCRANSRHGGAKTYWTDAAYPLLTHKAFETHAVVKPSLNDFHGMVFDELPALVYRYPKLRVSPERVKDGRAKDWQVYPLDNIVESFKKALASLDAADPKTTGLQRAVAPVLEKLEAASKKLRAKGSDLLRKTMAGDLKRGVVKADTLEPLLSLDEFAALMKLGNVEPEADEAGADESATGGDQAQYALLNHLSTLRDFCGSANLDVFLESSFESDGGSLWVCRPVNGWPDLLNLPDGTTRPTVLLDATAGLDPRYLLAGQWDAEETPDGEFPNTTIVLTDPKYRSKSKVKELGALDLAALVVEQVMPFLGQMVDQVYRDRHPGPPRLLVVTAKSEMKAPLSAALHPYTEGGKLAAEVAVEHFGGLRGRNDFRDFDAVYLTHLHLYDDAFFFGLELLLREFGKPFDRQWVPKATWYRKKSLALQHRAQVADIYQDTLRIGIRSDPERRAFIFLPTSDAGLVVRVMRLFRGARLVLSDGELLESPLARPPHAAAPAESKPASGAALPARFGTPR